MTFERFAEVNRQRCESPKGFKHALSLWSTSDWFTAILGELGEAANVAKKLNRVRDGIPGNKQSESELRAKIRQELGDTFVYLDLLCQSLGFTVGCAAVEVFNAKSAEIGYEITIEPDVTQQRQALQEALKAVQAWFKEMDDPDGPYDVKSGTPLDIEGHMHRVEALRNAAKKAVSEALALSQPPEGHEEK